jgi:hypothetical protein
VLLVRRHVERLLGEVRDRGLEQAHHGRELAAAQGVAHEQHPLAAQRIQQPARVERQQRAVVRLPAPKLVRLVRTPRLLAGELRLDVRALLLAVQRVTARHVGHPAPGEQVALLVVVVQCEGQPPLPLPSLRLLNRR